MALALALAILGVLLAVLALLVALRTERHVRRLALALAREWGLTTGRGEPEGGTPAAGRAAEESSQVRRSLQALEQHVHELEARLVSAASGTPETPAGGLAAARSSASPRERLEAHLLALGYDDVVLLPGRTGGWIYEAREQGMPRKGRAEVTPDGRVRIASPGALRAFP